MKQDYEKPKVEKVREMNFPVEILNKDGKVVVCKQCSNCHSCR